MPFKGHQSLVAVGQLASPHMVSVRQQHSADFINFYHDWASYSHPQNIIFVTVICRLVTHVSLIYTPFTTFYVVLVFSCRLSKFVAELLVYELI